MNENKPLVLVLQSIQEELNALVIKYINSGIPAFLIDKVLESILADVRKITVSDIIDYYNSNKETSAEEEKVDAESL